MIDEMYGIAPPKKKGPFSTVLRAIGTVLKYFVVTFALAVIYYTVFSLVIYTDKEKRIARENKLYQKTYSQLIEREYLLSDALAGLEVRDNQIYEDIFSAQPPKMELLLDDDFLSGVDSIPDRVMVSYAYDKVTKVENTASKVEDNFRKLFALSEAGNALPPLSLPLDSISYAQVGASIGQRLNPFYKVETPHYGIDLIAPQGDPVFSSAPGVVTLVSMSRKGLGNVVEITHQGGYVTRYCHLADIVVVSGQRVSRHQKLASVGISGNSFAPHLHYEIRHNEDILDPVDFFFMSVTPDEYMNMKYMATRTGQSMD